MSSVPTRPFPCSATTISVLVVQACASGAVSARDAAITLLALTTGLRACDIIGLRLSDIDWRSRTAEIVQQKTHNPLTVPLTELVVVKLADYVLDDRPDSTDGTCSCVARPHTFASPITLRSIG